MTLPAIVTTQIWAGSWGRLSQKTLAGTGGFVVEQWHATRHLAAVLATTLFLSAQPRRWRRTVHGVFARQILFSGVESIRFILILAVLVGISVVVQLDVWTGKIGQSQALGKLLVVVVARELAPLLANLVLIVRSGSAIATELGLMKVGGEVRLLEAQGIDPLSFLVMPRVLAVAVSAFCLTVIFILVAFVSGYFFGAFARHANMDPAVFMNGVFKAVHPFDGFSIIASNARAKFFFRNQNRRHKTTRQ